MIKAIIPECYVDTCLINVLLELRKDGVNHGKGNSTVTGKMKTVFSDAFAVGIIDRDKRAVEYINEFDICNKKYEERLLLFKHKSKHHYIIQICPESETWICEVSKALTINITKDYGLPADPKELAKLSKNVEIQKDQRFVALFREIRKKGFESDYLPVVALTNWLKYLIEYNYNADINQLKNG